MTIASNTGAVSVVERLITRSTAALAVCWASASCVSLKSRAFWIAITAWSANVRASAISGAVNGRCGVRAMSMVPIALPCHVSGANSAE